MSLRSPRDQIALEHEELERNKNKPRLVFDWNEHYEQAGRRHLFRLHSERSAASK